jgi:hypothetical protein
LAPDQPSGSTTYREFEVTEFFCARSFFHRVQAADDTYVREITKIADAADAFAPIDPMGTSSEVSPWLDEILCER